RLPAASQVVGHPVETSCTILDLNGVGLTNFYKVKDTLMEAAAIGQNYYPECMGKFYIINAPYLFSAVWSVVKGWLDEVTVKKIQVMSTGHKEVLLKQIDAENLPVEFGGSCRCPGGCSLSDAGPWHETATATNSAPAPSTI
ncbi:cytosolic factor, phosphatidylinositol/phosphatidylcholine transfer protein, partial [Serendipita sp. 399]